MIAPFATRYAADMPFREKYMHATEKQALERVLKQTNPGEISTVAISSVADTNGIRSAMRQLEAIATRAQKSGSEVLLVVLKR